MPKPLADMTRAEIVRAHERASGASSAVNRRCIDAGLGHMRGSEIRARQDQLGADYRAVNDALDEIVLEMRRRERWHGSLHRIKPSKF